MEYIYEYFLEIVDCKSARNGLTNWKTFFFNKHFKGTVSRDFRLLVFFMNQFPQASEYIFTAISNFFENSPRYSQLKVHHRCQRHRWQMEKIFKQKNFNNFVWAPLGSRVNIYISFCLQVHFKVSAACSARDWDRIRITWGNPQSGCSEICASLKGPL
jgi:hypothetical protein